jgi:protein phosphatase 1 regulatory subunit 7
MSSEQSTAPDAAPPVSTDVVAVSGDKPRARLGPLQELTTPAYALSDDEDDEDLKPAGDARDDDFLATYPDDTDELHLQHLRLHNSSLPPLRLPRFTGLRRLCLRQNELSSPLPVEQLALPSCEELDLYDNRLGPRVEDEELKGFKDLT